MNYDVVFERMPKLIAQTLCALPVGLLSTTAAAQTPQLYIYPLKQQSSEQQD